MKIAFVCPDGLSVLLFSKGIISALKAIEGAEVFVLTKDGIYKKDIEALGVKSISVDVWRFVNPLKDFKYMVTLYRIFKRERFDIVINFTTKPNIYGTIAAKMANTNTILSHIVGLGSASLPTRDMKSRLLRYIFFKLYHLSCKLSDRVWFTNKNDLAYFVSQGMVAQEKTILSRNYLDIDYYSPKTIEKKELSALREELRLSDQDKVVVMVARMIWPKGIKEFIEASELLKDKYPHVKFLLIAPLENEGPNAVPESYVREKEKLTNFKWLGFRNDVKNLYALSDLAVLPTYYKEGGYPRALLEPMAMGKPVITTDSPDCRGVVEEGRNGYLVPVKNSKLLSEAIEQLIIDENKCNDFGKYSRMKVEREFDEKLIVQKVISEVCQLQQRIEREGDAVS